MILCDGFIDYHQNTCKDQDCPAKTRVIKTTKFTKMLRQQGEPEQIITLLSIIQGLYQLALKKFPNSTQLRIMYSFYLLDIQNYEQQALQEMMNAEQEIPTFEEEFIIFRFKKLIEEEMSQTQKETKIKKKGDIQESVNELAVQNHTDYIKLNVEESANLHAEFWSQILEDHPDLGRIAEIGYRLSVVDQEIQIHWEKLQKIDEGNATMLRFFAKYTIDILNDYERGMYYLQRIVATQSLRQQSIGTDIQNESQGTIVISGEEDSYGLISNINSQAAGILGYQKLEVMNKKIQTTMPQVYGQFHDSFLDSYLQTLEGRILNQEKYLPSKHRTDNILMTYANIKHIPSLIHGVQFIGSLTMDKTLKKQCCMIVDTNGKIIQVSGTCIPFLRIDNDKIQKKEIKIQTYIADIMDNIEQALQKNGIDQICKVKEKQKKIGFKVNVKAFVVNFRKQGLQGYILVIVKKQDRIPDEILEVEIRRGIETNHCHFELNFDVNPVNMYPTFFGHIFLNNADKGPGSGDNFINSNFVDSLGNVREQNRPSVEMGIDHDVYNHIDDHDHELERKQQQKIVKIINYGEGIRAVRLIEKRLIDVEDLNEQNKVIEEELDDREDEELIFKASELEALEMIVDQDVDINQVFSKSQNFRYYIEKSNFLRSKVLTILKKLIVFYMVFISIFTIVNNFSINSALSESKDSFNIIYQTKNLISDGQIVLRNLLEIYIIQEFQQTDKTSQIPQLRNQIQETLKEMDDIQKLLTNSTITLTEEHTEYYYEDVVDIKYLENNQEVTRQFDINEATQQILSKINYMADVDPYDKNDPDFYFLEQNLLNQYYIDLNKVSNFYVEQLEKWSEDKQGLLFTFQIIGGVLSLITFIIILPFFFQIKEFQKEVLLTFLQINIASAKKLHQNSEKFLTQLQSGEADEIQSDSEGEQQEDKDIKNRRKTRKRYKISLKATQGFFIPFLLVTICFEGYIYLSFIISQNNADEMNQYVQEQNITSTLEGFLGFTNNVLVERIIDPQFKTYMQSSTTYLENSLDEMFQLSSLIQKEHSQTLEIHTDIFNKLYNQIMIQEPCKTFSENDLSVSGCESFAEGAMFQGLTVGLNRYYKNFRIFITQLNENEINQNIPYSDLQKQLLSSDLLEEMRETQDIYCKQLLRHLIKVLIEQIEKEYNNSYSLKLTFMIVSLILYFIVYLFVWIPYLSYTEKEVFRIRSMIYMIPLEICASVKPIRTMLMSYFNKVSLEVFDDQKYEEELLLTQ